eukprot:gene7158-9119_t
MTSGSISVLHRHFARAIKGVRAVLRVPLDRGAEGVAVLADGYWAAKQGREALKYRAMASQEGPRKFDADMAPLAGAPLHIEAEFVFPYLAHAAMEPLNCTVQLGEGSAELWVGTQFSGIDSAVAARVLGIKPEQVKMNVQMAGGGFGRRAASSSDFVVEACGIARAARATNGHD